MFRTLFAWTTYFFSTLILGTVAIFLSLFDSSGNIPHLVARLWGKIQLRTTGTQVKIQGLENINPHDSYILVSNHQSNFDIFALLGYLPIQFRWTAKAELFRTPFMGWAMSRIGYIPIERDSPKKAYRSMLQAAEKVKEGVSVMIFPEGTRSPDGKLQPFKKGVFLIALKSQAPILPITIRGTEKIMPKGDWHTYPGRVQITIEQPIETAGMPPKKEGELSERVRNTLKKHLAQT
ncbi:MAG: 1-acyl-sn-glycerol-3-phosphate acyltransferase [Deltaproteobacteria bacterium]|nr:1-acyl-sn-glycerol-3-phosphate acyltransferase [Deltaproteobacteria bacterium]